MSFSRWPQSHTVKLDNKQLSRYMNSPEIGPMQYFFSCLATCILFQTEMPWEWKYSYFVRICSNATRENNLLSLLQTPLLLRHSFMLSCFLSALCSRLIMSWVMMTCLVLVQLRNLAHSPQNRLPYPYIFTTYYSPSPALHR